MTLPWQKASTKVVHDDGFIPDYDTYMAMKCEHKYLRSKCKVAATRYVCVRLLAVCVLLFSKVSDLTFASFVLT